MSHTTTRLAELFTAVVFGLVAVAVVRKRRFDDEVETHVDELLSDAETQTGGVFTEDDLTDLPAPVRRYFEYVLEDGQPYVRTAWLRQRGEFRLGGADAPWRPLRATQYFTTAPPGFVWDATIDVAPLLSARAVDFYKRSEGVLEATVFGSVPVASVGPTPEMNEGELVRYLGEAVLFPTALLPTQGVRWTAIDDSSARASLDHGETHASLVFHFTDEDEVGRVTTERYRQEDDSYAPWTGYFRDYELHNGVRTPTSLEVEWNLPEGDLSYWRAAIELLEYDTVETSRPVLGER